MPTNQRFRFVAIVGLVVALLSAGISLAGGATDTPDDPEVTTCEPIDDGDVVDGEETVGDGDVVDGDEAVDEGDEPTDTEGEGDEPTDTEDCDDEAVQDDPVETEEEGSDDAVKLQEYTEEGCLEAAGATGGEGPTEGPVPGELHGLENAFAHVLWNCLDHPNHGLVNALKKLEPKLEGWLERQDLREERKAEREAAKAEREAARGAAKAARDAAHEAAKAARDAAKAARTAAHAN